MSINHISLWPNTPQFYHHHHHHPPPETTTTTTTMFGFNLNNMSDEEIEEQIERNDSKPEPEGAGGEGGEMLKEHLFEKPLTPSDVGKLNRLVIPKQHAEKYFPLTGNNNSNSNSNSNNNNESGGIEKGLLLSFEDELGKSWRFRYSYWNSSQSYVLTKGWSRFVKEKSLDAGDIVLFERHRMDGDRLFIGWRRRNASAGSGSASIVPIAVQENNFTAVVPPRMGGVGGWGQVYYGGHTYPEAAGLPYQPDCLHAGRGVTQNQTTASANNTRRQVRLFGVNLECEADESPPPTLDGGGGSSTSSRHHHHGSGQGQASQHYYQDQFDQYSNPHVSVPPSAANNNHHNHMDVNISRDVNQMRYHKG